MKISFNLSFYIFALIILLSGYINYLIIYLLIMLFHELGHIIMIKLFKYKIDSIIFYPFGGIINTNINLNISSYKLFLISISGILFQIILFLIVPNTINYNYEIFKMLNYSLIVYNLLPIYPLDGYKILLSINEQFFKYRCSISISHIISIIVSLLFYYFTKNTIIFLIIYLMNISYILKSKYIYNKFIIERYLYPTNYKRYKYINKVKDIYKCRNNYILCDNIYKEEKEVLEKYLCKPIDI